MEAVALLRSLADGPQVNRQRAERTYKCRRCLQPKKGHTCPVRSALKDRLWRDGQALDASCFVVGDPRSAHFGSCYSTLLDPSAPRGGGDSGNWGGFSYNSAPCVALGSKRLHLITKLMQRIARRIASLPSAGGECPQSSARLV